MIQSSRITLIRSRKRRVMRVGNEIESGGLLTAELAMGVVTLADGKVVQDFSCELGGG
jgi:Cys-tRNA synthase (O-phospho-L-seryl-tRNA:Cys-tRNA synthase)